MSSTRGTQPQPQARATSTSSEEKGTFDKLIEKLNERGISLLEFGVVDERRRKRMLKDDYQELKDEGKWKYDEPIEYPPEVLEKEKERAKARLEAASKAK